MRIIRSLRSTASLFTGSNKGGPKEICSTAFACCIKVPRRPRNPFACKFAAFTAASGSKVCWFIRIPCLCMRNNDILLVLFFRKDSTGAFSPAKRNSSLSPGKNRKFSRRSNNINNNNADEMLPDGFISTKWKTVHTHFSNEAVIEGPSHGAIRMLIRVRALNAAGWSDSSPGLNLNYTTHPSLFPTGFEVKDSLQHEQQRLLTNATPTLTAHDMTALMLPNHHSSSNSNLNSTGNAAAIAALSASTSGHMQHSAPQRNTVLLPPVGYSNNDDMATSQKPLSTLTQISSFGSFGQPQARGARHTISLSARASSSSAAIRPSPYAIAGAKAQARASVK
jgi:hypothetical protein